MKRKLGKRSKAFVWEFGDLKIKKTSSEFAARLLEMYMGHRPEIERKNNGTRNKD